MSNDFVEAQESAELSVIQERKGTLVNASALATDVAKIVRANGLSKRFGASPKEHVFIEGWSTIARVNNEQPHTKVEQIIKNGDEEIIHAKGWLTSLDGKTVSEADGYCSTEEQNWKGKPFYARASMAQTRALGKAMRLRHSWVMVMAGFSPTPAEEMDGVEPKTVQATVKDAPKPIQQPVQQKAVEATPEASKLNLAGMEVGETIKVSGHNCKVCASNEWVIREGGAKSKNPGRKYLSCGTKDCKDEGGKYSPFGGFLDEVMTKYQEANS